MLAHLSVEVLLLILLLVLSLLLLLGLIEHVPFEFSLHVHPLVQLLLSLLLPLLLLLPLSLLLLFLLSDALQLLFLLQLIADVLLSLSFSHARALHSLLRLPAVLRVLLGLLSTEAVGEESQEGGRQDEGQSSR